MKSISDYIMFIYSFSSLIFLIILYNFYAYKYIQKSFFYFFSSPSPIISSYIINIYKYVLFNKLLHFIFCFIAINFTIKLYILSIYIYIYLFYFFNYTINAKFGKKLIKMV